MKCSLPISSSLSFMWFCDFIKSILWFLLSEYILSFFSVLSVIFFFFFEVHRMYHRRREISFFFFVCLSILEKYCGLGFFIG